MMSTTGQSPSSLLDDASRTVPSTSRSWITIPLLPHRQSTDQNDGQSSTSVDLDSSSFPISEEMVENSEPGPIPTAILTTHAAFNTMKPIPPGFLIFHASEEVRMNRSPNREGITAEVAVPTHTELDWSKLESTWNARTEVQANQIISGLS